LLKRLAIGPAAAAAATAFALAGCASAPIGQDPGVTVVNTAELPPPTPQIVAEAQPGGAVAPGDVVTMHVYGTTDFDTDAVVSSDGTIAFPFTGPIQAAGMTIPELRSVIASRLSPRYVRDPQVQLTTKPGPTRMVSVGGQVNKPGFISTDGATTLLRAVVGAGGITDYAKRDEAIIIRQVGPNRYLGVYDIGAIQRGNYADPALYPGDIVMVGENRFWFFLSRAVNLTQVIASPVIAIDRITQ
jgi:polysaccharide export outer membrane protein